MQTTSIAIVVATVVVGALAPPAAAWAQIDYRNLDSDRPVLVEDAYPIERYAFELLVPYRAEREGDGTVHLFLPELEYGIVANAHVGVKLPVAALDAAGTTDVAISGLKVFAQYNFNTEALMLPALALRADATFPVGAFGGSHTRVTFKGIATRSFGLTRLHVNGAYTVGSEGTPAVAEAAPTWWTGVAIDRTLFRESVLLIAEGYVLRQATGEAVQVNASAGIRYQWQPTMVIDVGVSRRLRADGPDWAVTFGISKAFAVPWLMPGVGR
jgi:hypothetical protein